MIGEEEPLITVVSSGRADFSVGDIQSGRSSKSASAGIPNRFSMLNLSWVFLFASITLTAGFIMLHTTLITNAGLVNATFSISSIAWLYGFGLLIHWVLCLPGPLDTLGLIAAIMKFVASIFFNIQPASALINQDLGCDWSNLVGIFIFHIGNLVSVWGMRSMFDYKKPFSFGNLSIYGMWCYFIATTHLTIANTLFYYKDIAYLDGHLFTYVQVAGGLFLCLGSVLYIVWASKGGYMFPK